MVTCSNKVTLLEPGHAILQFKVHCTSKAVLQQMHANNAGPPLLSVVGELQQQSLCLTSQDLT